ncbi:MAG TPA: 16S rRNA (cytidine(1402)-2'-O)-methyltransferase [Acidimicrobiales bacterium]|nr:16S rRNA (cytidine(1402)-2'-O)-methyltransferase [Acidimicrobiales bacterium]
MNEISETPDQGTLYLVATPIGNLGDMSERAREVIEQAAIVACEDTRRTGRLLELLQLRARRLLVANEHTELSVASTVIEVLVQGLDVALVTDAGTPAISDPGQHLVRYVLDAGCQVSVVPGPTAAVAALVLSGLPTSRWVMEGFLPRKGKERDTRLASLAVEKRTTVLFESPRRLKTTLQELADLCGADRPAAVMRELTKLHEEGVRGSLGELAARFSNQVKGEIVVVIGGAADVTVDDDVVVSALRKELESGTTRRAAIDHTSATLGVARNRVYALALELTDDP